MPATLSAGAIAAPGPPMSVRTQPGWITTAVTPRGAMSMARLFTAEFCAAFEDR